MTSEYWWAVKNASSTPKTGTDITHHSKFNSDSFSTRFLVVSCKYVWYCIVLFNRFEANSHTLSPAHPTVEPVSGKNFTSASFPAPQAYVLRNDPVARAEFEATAAAELSKSLHFTQAPSEAYALDKMYSSARYD